MTWGRPLQQQDPAGFCVKRGEKKHFLPSLLPTVVRGGAPVCGLLVFICRVCVFEGHFSFVFLTPFDVLGREGLLQTTAIKTVQFSLHLRLLGLQTPKGRVFKAPAPE